MHARVRRTIQERALLSPGETLLVACSGGSDSIAMLHVLADLRTGLFVASLDHGLRDESADDVAFVALADDARAAQRVVVEAADAWTGPLAHAPRAVRRVLIAREVASSGRRLGRAHLEALDRMVQSDRGEVRLGGGFVAHLDDGGIAVRAGVDRKRSTD